MKSLGGQIIAALKDALFRSIERTSFGLDDGECHLAFGEQPSFPSEFTPVHWPPVIHNRSHHHG